MIGRVHSIQSLGGVDGPGLRSVVFFQGCALRCPYCHNPDTWDLSGGEDFEAGALSQTIARNRAYIDGVTLSGGEPLLQAEFALELLKHLKSEGLHTAMDTSGYRIPDCLPELSKYTDLFLLDIKMNDRESHQKHIGISLDAPLNFLKALSALNARVWIRQVLVPGIHDRPGEDQRRESLLKPYKCVEKVELLPFKKLCAEKYQRMGIPFPFEDVPEWGYSEK